MIDPNLLEDFPDPIDRLILTGRATTAEAAEELFLNESLGEAERLVGSELSNEELARHSLLVLYRRRGLRGREDSLP